jgi:hypothetical protein
MAITGRPSDYDGAIADVICAEIATSSKSIRTICKAKGMPHAATVMRWLRTNELFREQYARAKEEQADYLAEEMLEIADSDGDDEKPFVGSNHIQRDKLKVETRKWIAAKLKPKKYGDKIDMTSGGEKLPPINLSALPTEVLKEMQQLITRVNGNA